MAVPWGELLIGRELLVVAVVRLAAFFGALMMLMFYFGNWDIAHGLINDDFAYMLVFLAVAAFGADVCSGSTGTSSSTTSVAWRFSSPSLASDTCSGNHALPFQEEKTQYGIKPATRYAVTRTDFCRYADGRGYRWYSIDACGRPGRGDVKLALRYVGRRHMTGWGQLGWGMILFGLLWMALLIGLPIDLVYWLVNRIQSEKKTEGNALAVLRELYARGNIEEEEYERRRSHLSTDRLMHVTSGRQREFDLVQRVNIAGSSAQHVISVDTRNLATPVSCDQRLLEDVDQDHLPEDYTPPRSHRGASAGTLPAIPGSTVTLQHGVRLEVSRSASHIRHFASRYPLFGEDDCPF